MDELFKKFKWMLVLVGSLLLSAGILVFVIAIVNPGIISLILSIVVACCLFIAAGVAITSSLLYERKQLFSTQLAYAALVIGLGVILCMETNLLAVLVIQYVAIAAIVAGGVALIRAVFAIVWRDKTQWIVLLFAAATIGITLGVIILVFQLETVMLTIIYVVIALCLSAVGVFQIIKGIKLLNNNNK